MNKFGRDIGFILRTFLDPVRLLTRRRSVPSLRRIWWTNIRGFAIIIILGIGFINWFVIDLTQQALENKTQSAVEAAAIPAAYAVDMVDPSIAKSVTDGLIRTGAFSRVELIDDFGTVLAVGEREKSHHPIVDTILSLFAISIYERREATVRTPTGHVGQMILFVDHGQNGTDLLGFLVIYSLTFILAILIFAAITLRLSAVLLVNAIIKLENFVDARRHGRDARLPSEKELNFSELRQLGQAIHSAITEAQTKRTEAHSANKELTRQITVNENQAQILREVLEGSKQAIVYFSGDGNTPTRLADRENGPLLQGIPNQPYFNAEAFVSAMVANGQSEIASYQITYGPEDPAMPRRFYEIEIAEHNGTIRHITALRLGRAILAYLISDMTETRKNELALLQVAKMESLGTLASGVAHDYNNTLAVISSSLEAVEYELDARQITVSGIDTALEATRHGAMVVKSLLNFSRKTDQAPQPIDVNMVFADLENIVRKSMPININLSFSASEDAIVAADHSGLENALLNLILNARDAMPDGGTITLSAAPARIGELPTSLRCSPNDDFIKIVTSDTGHGLSEDVHAKLFDPFFTTKTKGRGTGLGLSMVFSFAKNLGGAVSATNNTAGGAEFTLFLPRSGTDSVTDATPRAPEIETQPGFAPAAVVLIEDEIGLHAPIRILFDRMGVSLSAFASHTDFVTNIDDIHNYDLVLTDLALGDGSGIDVVEYCRSHGAEIPILVMSGNFEFSQRDLDFDALFDGVIYKPYSLAHLGQTVSEAIIKDRRQKTKRLQGAPSLFN